MSFEIGPSFKFICDEITRKTGTKVLNNRCGFAELLKTLNAVERFLVAKFFNKSQWNVGSLAVLSVLHDLRILTATEFLLSLQDSEQVQLILNDFLETEHQLLVNVYISAYYDSSNTIKLNNYLDECIRCLFVDDYHLNYLDHVRKEVPGDLLLKITEKHIDIALDLYTSHVKEAFRNFSQWINEGVDEMKFTKALYEKLICHNVQEVLNYLFNLSTKENFKEWKFYLILLQTIASKSSTEYTHAAYIRKYLKNRLLQVSASTNKNTIPQLLLTARAVSATSMDISKNLAAYGDWYKQVIGEMKYVLKIEDFHIVLSQLEEAISYEREIEYLELHSTISISPPIACSKLVQAYKSKCKFHLTQLRSKAKLTDANESIVVHDSN